MILIDAYNLKLSFKSVLKSADEYISLESILKIIDAQESMNSKPISEWLICSDGYYPYCSNCQYEPENGKMTNYCPSCGSHMIRDKRKYKEKD